MSVTATAVIASALALPGASDATELSNKKSEAPWTVSLKHDLIVKDIDAKEVVKKRAPKSEDTEEKSASVGQDGSHEVVSGDTISEIAHKYGVSTEDLMAWNNLSNTLIIPGQQLALNGNAGSDADSEDVAEELVIVEVDEEAEREAVAVADAEAARVAEENAAAAEAERVAEEERVAAEQVAAEEAEAEAAAVAAEEERAAEEETEREAEQAAVAEAEAAEQAEREAEEVEAARLAEEEAAAEEAESKEAEEDAKVEEAPEVQQASNSTTNEAVVETVSAETESDSSDKQAQLEAEQSKAAEKKAEEDRVAAEKKQEEERIAAQKKKEEEERKVAEAAKKAEQDRIAAEKKEADRKAAEAAEQKKKEEEEAKAAEQNNVGGGDLISNARSVLGTPYVWGGSQPGGFDCSGFIHWAHKESGNDIGRNSVEGYYNKSYMVSNPQPGDLVFFEGTYKSGMSHMGIYIGGGQMIHAGSSTGVAITNVKGPYWGDHFHSYKRFY